MIRALLIRAVTGLCLGLPHLAVAQEQATMADGAVLRGLDKVSGHTVDVEVLNGRSGKVFGLDVALGECRYPTDNPTGDAFAFLTIRDQTADMLRFEGWMIASSPALNALDHSRYDVWVLRCITS